MRAVRSQDTGPEQLLSAALKQRRLRFQAHVENLPGRPDIVFSRKRVAIFVDGDFWHGRQWRRRGLQSLAAQFKDCDNREYWISKIKGNMRRDQKVARQLRSLGWSVLRVWEHEVKKDSARSAERVARFLEKKNAGR